MSTELNLTTLNWTAIECQSCQTVSEVLASDLELERSICCRVCGHDLQAADPTLNEPHDKSQMGKTATEDIAVADGDDPAISNVSLAKKTLAEPVPDQSPNEPVPTSKEYEENYDDASFESNTSGELLDVDLDELDFSEPKPSRRRSARSAKKRSKRSAHAKQWLQERRDDFAGAIVSVILHGIVLLILALIMVQLRGNDGHGIIVSISDQSSLDPPSMDDSQVDAIDIAALPTQHVEPEAVQVAAVMNAGRDSGEPIEFAMPAREAVSRHAAGDSKWAIGSGTGFEGRKGKARAKLAAANGGTPESEAAVESGLAWIAKHQLADGSWSFRDSTRIEGCTCGNHGRFDARTGATGMALLAFLGAGYTHQEGEYQEVVKQGLTWLAAQSDVGDFRFTRKEAP